MPTQKTNGHLDKTTFDTPQRKGKGSGCISPAHFGNYRIEEGGKSIESGSTDKHEDYKADNYYPPAIENTTESSYDVHCHPLEVAGLGTLL